MRKQMTALKGFLLLALITAFSITSYAQSAAKCCPEWGTPECKLVKNCPKKGTADCPYTKSASATKASASLADCSLAGTPDCPLIKNCPKKGTKDCPYANQASVIVASAKNDADLPACCRKK